MGVTGNGVKKGRGGHAGKYLASVHKGTHGFDDSFVVLPENKRTVVMVARMNFGDSSSTEKEDRMTKVREEFKKCGKIAEIDERSAKGPIFVSFKSTKHALKACSKLNGAQLLGADERGLVVSMCKRSLKGMVETKKQKRKNMGWETPQKASESQSHKRMSGEVGRDEKETRESNAKQCASKPPQVPYARKAPRHGDQGDNQTDSTGEGAVASGVGDSEKRKKDGTFREYYGMVGKGGTKQQRRKTHERRWSVIKKQNKATRSTGGDEEN